VTVLILGSHFDLTCDYVVAQLRRENCPYVRINSEDLPHLRVSLEPTQGVLLVRRDSGQLRLTQSEVRSIFFRRPVYLRDYGTPIRPPAENFHYQQWASFIRNLMVLEGPMWVNHPTSTYLAEHKAVQLRRANEIGFLTPETIITNDAALIPFEVVFQEKVIVKGLDTVLMREGSMESFGFTHIFDATSLREEEIAASPVMFQEPIFGKLDVRVTVVGSDVFAASITADGKPIQGDWRCTKGGADFQPHNLPTEVADKCVELVKDLGLRYGAIDLVLKDAKYYFLEVNPTGEWAWLVDSAGLPIDSALCKLLSRPEELYV
jgi:glutathione synthase/RimK-type ligase-like ATP-grasp enzyme